MSIRPIAVDVDPEEGVMLRSDFSYFADMLDCLLSSSFPSYHRSPVRYDLVYLVRYDLKCYVLVERSARLELGGYDLVVWHVVLEAFASDTR